MQQLFHRLQRKIRRRRGIDQALQERVSVLGFAQQIRQAFEVDVLSLSAAATTMVAFAGAVIAVGRPFRELAQSVSHSFFGLLYAVARKIAGYSFCISQNTCSSAACSMDWRTSKQMVFSYWVAYVTGQHLKILYCLSLQKSRGKQPFFPAILAPIKKAPPWKCNLPWKRRRIIRFRSPSWRAAERR